MQSANYVPGVSGWKINTATGEFEANSDGVSVSGVDPNARYCGRSRAVSAVPFIVHEGKVYISQAMIDQCVIDPAQLAVKLERNGNGQYVATGIGLGVSEFEKARAKGPDAVLRYLSEEISSSKLATDLRRSIDDGNSDLAVALAEAGKMKLEKVASKDRERAMEEVVRDVLRKEVRPGGLLSRR
jgi:hypothetical protein